MSIMFLGIWKDIFLMIFWSFFVLGWKADRYSCWVRRIWVIVVFGGFVFVLNINVNLYLKLYIV